MNKKILIVSILLLFINCAKDDGNNASQSDNNADDIFYSNNDQSVSKEELVGIWSIYVAEYVDGPIDVPPNYPSCGRDYFVFDSNGNYTEYIYQNTNCNPRISELDWDINKGIIKLSNPLGNTDEIAITGASNEELILKYRFDIDDDNELDVFTAFARRYDPITDNNIAKAFKRNLEESSLLQFNWDSFKGPGQFDRYEIHRSNGSNCDKNQAELIISITDVSTTEFIDLNPPPTQENICYFLKIFSSKGLIGESPLWKEDPKNIVITESVNLNTPIVGESSIELNWSSVNIPYFSHYEIVYANSDASNLLFHEEASNATINDIEKNSFLDSDPPYLENPFYSIHAYNIFGSKVQSNYEGITFRRKDLLGPINLYSILHDPVDPIIYFYGNSKIPDWASYDEQAIIRYNYSTGQIESYTDSESSFGFESPISLIVSPEGKEIISGPEHFYDPISLSEIFSFGSFYLFEQFELFPPADFLYTKNGFWAIIDMDHLFVFDRNGQELNLIDKEVHFTKHHGDNYYRMLNINENQILIGHKEEPESILFTLNENGEIVNKSTVSIPLESDYLPIYRNRNISFYSDSDNFLINYADKTLYSTLTFDAKEIIPEEVFAIGISLDGKYIFATNNNPDWFGSDIKTEFFKREAVIYDVISKQITKVSTKGYPIRIFENNLGEIICISVPENQIPVNFDVFVEKIEIP